MEIIKDGKVNFSFTTGTKEQQPSEWTVRLNSAPTFDTGVIKFEPVEFEWVYSIDEDGNLVATEKRVQ